MNRKFICAFILSVLTSLLLLGCGAANSTSLPTQKDTPSEDSAINNVQQNHISLTSDDSALSEFSDMEKAIHTLMLSCFKNDMAYDSQNPDYFWTAVHFGIVNYKKEVPSARRTAAGIRVPDTAVREFASGLFAGTSDLPRLPDTITGIRYDSDLNTYIFLPDPMEHLSTRLLSVSGNDEGSTSVAAALYDSDADIPIACYRFTLVPNTFAEDIRKPLFSHSVSSMNRSSAVNCCGDFPTLTGNYQGFIDETTAVFTIDGNLMAFHVNNAELVSILSLLEEDTRITFAVDIDKRTEKKTIISIKKRVAK